MACYTDLVMFRLPHYKLSKTHSHLSWDKSTQTEAICLLGSLGEHWNKKSSLNPGIAQISATPAPLIWASEEHFFQNVIIFHQKNIFITIIIFFKNIIWFKTPPLFGQKVLQNFFGTLLSKKSGGLEPNYILKK